MAFEDPRTLVSTEWLGRSLRNPDLRILDGSWHLPGSDRNARGEYYECHIPGARFFDIDEISDTSSQLPHMAPPVEKFMSRMRAMGVGDGHQVIVYDSQGLFSAARVWWLFRLMGHFDVAVLDGGLPKWMAEGRPVEDLPPVIRDRHMTVRRQSQMVRDVTEVARAAKLGDAQIIDARPRGRYLGTEAEPRPELRSGHIPGSINLPYSELLNPDGTFRDREQLRQAFDAAGADIGGQIIASCGSGVTACIIALALELLGHRDHSVYDGSWSEWGRFGDLPIESG